MNKSSRAAELVGKVVRTEEGLAGKVLRVVEEVLIDVAIVNLPLEVTVEADSVTVVENPTREQSEWEGGFGFVSPTGSGVVPSHTLGRAKRPKLQRVDYDGTVHYTDDGRTPYCGDANIPTLEPELTDKPVDCGACESIVG